jgi:hypothetical protein
MKLIFASLLIISLRAGAESMAEPDDQTQAKAAMVETVCAGACHDKQTAPLLTKPVKAKYQENQDTINRVDGVLKPEQIEKSKAKPEEPIGA